MLTPGSTAFDSSIAVPVMEACCAYAAEPARNARATRTTMRNLLTGHPPSRLTSCLSRRLGRRSAIDQLFHRVDPSVGDHPAHLVRVGDVRQRIALDDDEI